MINNSEILNDTIGRTIKKVLSNNPNTIDYFKNVNKHSNCSNFSTPITMKNYKKDRTVCKNWYNTNTYNLMKKRLLYQKKPAQANKQDLVNEIVLVNKQVLVNEILLVNKLVLQNEIVLVSKQVLVSEIVLVNKLLLVNEIVLVNKLVLVNEIVLVNKLVLINEIVLLNEIVLVNKIVQVKETMIW